MASLLRRATRCLWSSIQQSGVRYYEARKKFVQDDFAWATPLVERAMRGEPHIEPAKLHMVCRIKELKHRPKYEKDIIEDLGLDCPRLQKMVFKNTPEINEKLRAVKHLIKVVPITFPFGPPKKESEYENCILKDNGEFVVQRQVFPLSEERVDTTPTIIEDKWQMDKNTLDKHLRRKKERYEVNAEYFKPKYVYKHNQDGKEFRYFGDWNIGGNRDWY